MYQRSLQHYEDMKELKAWGSVLRHISCVPSRMLTQDEELHSKHPSHGANFDARNSSSNFTKRCSTCVTGVRKATCPRVQSS